MARCPRSVAGLLAVGRATHLGRQLCRRPGLRCQHAQGRSCPRHADDRQPVRVCGRGLLEARGRRRHAPGHRRQPVGVSCAFSLSTCQRSSASVADPLRRSQLVGEEVEEPVVDVAAGADTVVRDVSSSRVDAPSPSDARADTAIEDATAGSGADGASANRDAHADGPQPLLTMQPSQSSTSFADESESSPICVICVRLREACG